MHKLFAALLAVVVAAPVSAERDIRRYHRDRPQKHYLHYHGKRHCWEKHERPERSGSMLVAHGTYVGDGTSNRKIDAEFAGAVLIIKARNATDATTLWIDTMDVGSAFLEGTGTYYNLVLDVTKTGFFVGTGSAVNGDGVAYQWLMLGKNDLRGGRELVTGTYTGNGVDDRSITIGFDDSTETPLIVGTGRSGGNYIFRSTSHSGDSSVQFFGTLDAAANQIQGFGADSFEVGANANVNQNGTTFHYFAVADNDKDNSIGLLTWTGNGSAQTLTGLGFEPTAVWFDGIDISPASESTGLHITNAPDPSWGLSASSGAQADTVSGYHSDGIRILSSDAINGSGFSYHGVFFSTIGQSAGGRLSTSLRDALRSGAQPLWLLDITFPDETRYYSNQGVASATDGLYKGKIVKGGLGSVSTQISDERGGAVRTVETSVSIVDHDRELTQLLTGQYASTIAITPPTARIRLAAPASSGVVPADWKTVFNGVLTNWHYPESFKVELILRPDDKKVRATFPGSQWTITRADFPQAVDDIIGLPAPLIYGDHLSPSFTAQGFIPLLCVNVEDPQKWLVCARAAKDVVTVYVDGKETAITWSFSIDTYNGKDYTIVSFDGDTPGDPYKIKVTADVQGYETTGDGTGTVITNPASQLAHLLSNFVFDNSLTGSWNATDTSLIDAEHLATAEDFCDARSYSGSRRISTVRTGRDLLAEWAVSHEARVWWTGEGKLAFGFEDPTAALDYQQIPWLHHPGDFLKQSGPSIRNDDTKVTTRVTVSYILDESTGQYVYTLNVADPYREEVQDTVSYPWSDAS